MSRHSFHAVFLCAVLGWGVVGSATASASDVQAEQPQQGLRVTYLLYSGRRNPSVLVTDPAQVRAIEEQLTRALTTGQRTVPAPSHATLGYTGIQIERLGDASRGAAPFILQGESLRVKSDAEHALTEPTVTVSRAAVALEDLLVGLGREQRVLGEVELSVIRPTK